MVDLFVIAFGVVMLAIIAFALVMLDKEASREPPLPISIIEHKSFNLAGGRGLEERRTQCKKGQLLQIAATPDEDGAWPVGAAGIGRVGHLTATHPVAQRLGEGYVVLHCSVSSANASTLNLKVVTGQPGARWQPPQPKVVIYKVSLVGEQSYRRAVRRVSEGDYVDFFREPDNPYDSEAVSVTNLDGETLGYLARGCWLRRSILSEQGRWIGQVDYVGGSPRGVRLRVAKDPDAVIGERPYMAPL